MQLAAEQGHPLAQLGLSRMYRDGVGVDADKQEAMKWLRESAERGFAEAQDELAAYYLNGKDFEEGIKWLRKAAEQGHEKARQVLDHITKNTLPRLREAAEEGDADAQCEHCVRYSTGDGVEIN